MAPSLNNRSAALLKALIEAYIETGQPVSSRVLANVSGLALKPASIRNIMAGLEEQGFLKSPHTSAGRVPTSSGYRFFVDSLLQIDPLEKSRQQSILAELANEPDHHRALVKASNILSGITNMASIILLPPRQSIILRHIEFLKIAEHKILVILVVNEQEVQNKVILTEEDITQRDLEKMANHINHKYNGKRLDKIVQGLKQEMQTMRDQMNKLMCMAIEMTTETIEEANTEEVLVSGETSLMDKQELANMEKLKSLFESFHNKHHILGLLDHCLHSNGVQIFIGRESGYEIFEDCSLVTSQYQFGEDNLGVLGVIGPKRMRYGKVIPVVELTSQILSSTLKS